MDVHVEETDFSKAKRALKSEDTADTKKKKNVREPKVDPLVPGSGYKVWTQCHVHVM